MNERQQIHYNETGQSLIWDAPEGLVSSVADVQVWRLGTSDDGSEEAATTGAASIDAVSTTVDANSGPSSANPRKLNVTATTNMAVDRRYKVTAATGEYEWVLCKEIASADYIICAHPLKNDYVSGATVVGARLSIGVDPTFVATSSKITDDLSPEPGYRVRWEYTSASITRVWDAYFDLVRYSVGHTVQPIDMESLVPNWRDRLPTYHQEDEGRRMLDEALRQVRWDFTEAGYQLSSLRSRDGLDELVRHKAWVCLEMAAVASGAGSQTVLEIAMGRYQSRLDQLVRVNTRLPMSTDSSGAGVRVSAVSIMSK